MPPVQSRLLTLPQPPASCADIVRRLEALPAKVGKFPDDESYLPAHVKKFAGKDILPLSLIATLLKSNAYTKHSLTRAIRSYAREYFPSCSRPCPHCIDLASLEGIDERSRQGGNSLKWCGSPERKAFYDEHPAGET